MPKRTRSRSPSGYEKVSATLERPVVQMIRETTPNVSEFLNKAAKEFLYYARIREGIAQLEREGYHVDPARVRRIRRRLGLARKTHMAR